MLATHLCVHCRRLLIPVLAIALGSCPTARGEPDAPNVRFEHDMMVRFHMHENFDLLRAIEKLLIRGKLEDANALARAIYTSPDEPGLAPWSPSGERAKLARKLQQLVDIARKSKAMELVERGRVYGELLTECAPCHSSQPATTLPSQR